MVENNKEWETTTERFVAFFDIMGFKDMVLRKKHEEVLDVLDTLSQAKKIYSSLNENELGDNDSKGETKSFIFSDSMFIFSKSNSFHDLTKMCLNCSFILNVALGSEIPIKGALSYGKITVDESKSIFFGQPIINAYNLHDELLMYNAILDNEFEKQAKSYDENIMDSYFQLYKAPLKSGRINHYLLKVLAIPTQMDGLNKLYESVSGRPRIYIDNTVEYLSSLNLNTITNKR